MKKKWLIWSIEHNGWWKANSSGYTRLVINAGRYNYEAALQIVTGANYAIYNRQGVTPNEAMCLAPEEVQ